MSDRVQCTAFYKDDTTVQLTNHNLAFDVSHNGGLVTYAVRYDDGQATEVFASERLKNIGAVILAGTDFDDVKSAKRLRIRIGTLVNGYLDYDLNLSMLTPVMEILSGKSCINPS